MSSTYVVSYDLKAPGKDYSELIEYLQSLEDWWHGLGSTWVVVTSMTARQLRDAIKAHTDSNDRVLVVMSSGVGAWRGLGASGNEWLQEHL
ncbi:SinR family protein [Nocardioides sp. WS12]|uniref:SinR family protein n=1 Tax=Nocardioides sp. WS12 TaxID=2486272 RepID=UPI0015FB23CB|nr:SinR family protein [Nocardioides sp. WS12]